MKRHFILGLIMFVMSFSVYANVQDSQQSLKAIDKTIHDVQKALNKNHIQKSKLEQILKDTEISIGNIDRNLVQINQQIKIENKKIAVLEKEKRAYEKELQSQKVQLEEALKTLYYLGNHNYLKTLLTQSGSDSFSRNMTYFKYLNQSRLKSMQKMQETLENIKLNQETLKTQTIQLEVILKEKKSQQQKLLQLKSSRSKILTSLNTKINNQQQKLSTLEKNKKRLQQLIKTLSEKKRIPIQPPLPFSKMQHQLHWPVNGKIIHRYGEQIENSQLTYSGVFISAPQGQYVHAIYPGKVIFSDWLKGFGLLIIIDHGNGYISLYGRNNALYHKVGDFINKDEVIASIGNSGGYQQSGLYFEIRKNGAPLNPAKWCH